MHKLFFSFLTLLAALGFVACNDKDTPTPDVPVTNVEKSISFDCNGGEQTIDFTADKSWRSASSAAWCTVSPANGTAGNGSIVIKVAANKDKAERTAKVTVNTANYNQPFVTVNITQAGDPNAEENVTPDPDPTPTYQDPEEENVDPTATMLDATSVVARIGVGWNLGNTCEGTPNEDSWGNPKASAELIAAVKAAGFNTLRIPVRWEAHADADMNIKEAWLSRVKEIIDYAYAQDMTVIINSHHDNWYDRLETTADTEQIKIKFGNMWTQIARSFRDYDDHLIFAGFNEIIEKTSAGENWGEPKASTQKFMNQLAQIFVDRVRATSGNNANRPLIINSYACNFDFVREGQKTEFKMPTDRIDGGLIYEFHMYTWTYSTEAAGNDNKYFWGEPYKDYSPWFKDGESELDWRFGEVAKKFINKGIPVIMGEFGCVQHNKSSDNAIADASRAYYHTQVVKRAKAQGIAPIYWDNGLFTSTDNENFGLFNRKSGNSVPARAQIALDGIMAGLE